MEPIRGQHIVLFFHTWLTHNPERMHTCTVLSDIFVFSYPIVLAYMYIKGIIQKNKSDKVAALYVFGSVVLTTIINIIIQFSNDKQRPFLEFKRGEKHNSTLLHQFLPESSFPSDHAGVSFAVATALFLRGRKYTNKWYQRCSSIFFVFAITMSVARIATAVHRPTDVIAGACVGALGATICMQKNIHHRITTYIFSPLIRCEEFFTRRKSK